MEDKIVIRGLSLMLSCGCNLNCEYCRIAQAVNAGSASLQQATIKALQDGSYIENLKNALRRCGQTPHVIESISLWGQEPTLTLHLLSEHLEDWCNTFPNWEHCMFSTNTVAHMDRILGFIQALDKYVKKDSFELQIQLSYDGDYATEKLRGVLSSQIHDNLVYLFTELNKIKLNKVKVRFNFHSVLSMDLLYNQLNTVEGIYNYTKAQKLWGEEFQKLNMNNMVSIPTRGVDMAIENPYNAGIEEGMKLKAFGEMSERFNVQDFYPELTRNNIDSIGPTTLHEAIYGGNFVVFDHILGFCDNHGIPTFKDLMYAISNDEKLKDEFFTIMNNNIYCGTGVGELKVMYDGTFINCQNHIYDTDIDLLPKNNDDLVACVKRSLASHHYFVNPLTATDYEIEQYFDLFHSCKFACLEYIFRTNVTMMELLVETHQIDPSYFNTEKLIAHAFLVAIIHCCSYNNQMTTGSIFTRPTGFLRLFCNGHLDNIIRAFHTQIRREVF